MGQHKPLLPWGEGTLIEYQIRKLTKTGNPLVVVLGSDSDLIAPVIQKYDVHTVINPSWEEGMGGSIAAGVRAVLRSHPGAEGLLVTLVDQPLVPLEHYNKMLDAFQPGNQSVIISSSANGLEGVPVLFDRCYMDELKVLEGDQGARKITQRHEDHLLRIPCGDILVDMDTMEAYQKLHEKFFRT